MQAGVVATLGLLFFGGPARAGDPIQFSTDKAKPAPANNQPVDADLFKSWNKAGPAPAPSSMNSLTPFIPSGRTIDPKDEKRLRNAREERRNWMLLEPGELDKEDAEDEQFGKALSLDKGDDDSRSYLFRGLGEAKSDRAGNSQRPTADTEEETRRENRNSLKIFGARELEQQGAHTASQLNLKGLIDTTQGPHANKNEATLFQFFKDNASPAPNRDEQARRDTFRDFINGPQPPKAAAGGLGDPINFRTDLTQERMNPVLPNRPFELPAPARAPDAFSAKPPPMGALNPARPLGFLEPVTGPRQPQTVSGLPSPLTPSEAKRPTVMGNSLFERELPRRGGL